VIEVGSNNVLGPEQKGELCFRGPLITKGYISNEVATKEAIDEEGWLHSGDLGYYDPDGYFYIVERLKEMIKYQGHQVRNHYGWRAVLHKDKTNITLHVYLGISIRTGVCVAETSSYSRRCSLW
jgi:non-ribosomal peptide synthetase component E (peptide arylation enzyme)